MAGSPRMSPRGCAGGLVGVRRGGRISSSPVVPSCVLRRGREGLQRRSRAHPLLHLDLPGQTPLSRVSGGAGGPPWSEGPPSTARVACAPRLAGRAGRALTRVGGRVSGPPRIHRGFVLGQRTRRRTATTGQSRWQTDDTWPPPDAPLDVPRTDEYKAELWAAPLARVRLGGWRDAPEENSDGPHAITAVRVRI